MATQDRRRFATGEGENGAIGQEQRDSEVAISTPCMLYHESEEET